MSLLLELNNKQSLQRTLSKNLILLLRGQIEPIFASLKRNLRLHLIGFKWRVLSKVDALKRQNSLVEASSSSLQRKPRKRAFHPPRPFSRGFTIRVKQ